MGINLKDVLSFTEGAIERDKEIGQQNLAMRNEVLQANKKELIEQKKKKYDRELNNFYEEEEKFNALEAAAAQLDSKTIDAATYASMVLPLLHGKAWDKLPPDIKKQQLLKFKGKTPEYKLVGSEKEINENAAAEISAINSEVMTALKNSKGDRKLINAILNKKSKSENEVWADVQSKIKATKLAKLSTKEIPEALVGLDVKVDGTGGLTAIFNHNDGKWLTQYNDAVKKSEYDGLTTEPMILDVVAAGTVKGFNTAPFIKKNDQGEVVGWTQNGQGFSSYVSQTYKTLHDNLADKNAILTSFNYNDTIGGANINSSKLIDASLSIVNQRGHIWKTDDGDISVFSAIPVGVINESNQFIVDGQVFSLDGKQMAKAIQLYDYFVEAQAIKNVKAGDEGIFDPQSSNDWINAWNELQINMNSNRNFVKGGKETKFAYLFKKKLVKDLNLDKADEISKLDDNKIIEDKEVVTVDKEEKKKIDTGKPYVKDNVIYFKTTEGDQKVRFENLDESQVNELQIKYPDIYKEYEIWLNNKNLSIDSSKVSEDTFTTNTNTFKNMLLESEKEILSGNKKNKNIVKKKKNITEGG